MYVPVFIVVGFTHWASRMLAIAPMQTLLTMEGSSSHHNNPVRAPRVGHKKSRKGCAQCKRRHVKVCQAYMSSTDVREKQTLIRRLAFAVQRRVSMFELRKTRGAVLSRRRTECAQRRRKTESKCTKSIDVVAKLVKTNVTQ